MWINRDSERNSIFTAISYQGYSFITKSFANPFVKIFAVALEATNSIPLNEVNRPGFAGACFM